MPLSNSDIFRLMMQQSDIDYDPYWDQVDLLMSFDQAAGSYIDESKFAHTVTQYGTFYNDTGAVSKSGTNARASGSSSALRLTLNQALGTGEFTIEWSAYGKPDDAAQWSSWIQIGTQNTNGLFGIIKQSGAGANVRVERYNSAWLTVLDVSSIFSAGTLTDFALTRDASGVFRVFKNGILVSSTTAAGLNFTQTNVTLFNRSDTSTVLICPTDEFRLTHACRYTSNYTPQTGAFPRRGP